MLIARKYISVLIVLILGGSLIAQAQWRGDKRDGHFEGENLLKVWPENGPEVIFEADNLGLGWGSAIESDDKVFIVGKLEDKEYLTALDLSGKVLWQSPIGSAWDKSFPDARTSPTLDGDRVYVSSGLGQITCLKVADGTSVWSVDTKSVFQSEIHIFGASESVLIMDDLVIATPGGEETSMVALNKYTGELIWKSDVVGGSRSYASPILFQNDDIKQLIGQTSMNFFGVNPADGSVQWTFPYFEFTDKLEKQRRSSVNLTNSPIYKGNEIFFSHGYDYPAVMLTLAADGKSVTPKWVSRTLDNHHHGFVELDGYIYGSNWLSNKDGKWVCLNWETGEVTYVHHWNGKGALVEADGLFYIMTEKDGYVGLLEPNVDEFKLISSFKLEGGEGMYWAHPAIFNGRLYLRHGGLLRAYDVSAKEGVTTTN